MKSFYHACRLDFLLFMRIWGAGLLASGFSFFLLYLSQPPGNFPEAAYFFLLPVLVWFTFKPKLKVVFLSVFITGFIYHVGLIGWIRHVTPVGMFLASIIITSYILPWFLLAGRWIVRGANTGFTKRLVLILALSSVWVIIEWTVSYTHLTLPTSPHV